jgi:H+/Cl- antiporter ClcA
VLVNETFGETNTVMTENSSSPNLIVAGIMIGLVAVFFVCLCYLLHPCLAHWLRRKVPVSAAQIQRRYQTIEGWLITKV